jgi:Tetracyclin repressor-like, C-terminal domain
MKALQGPGSGRGSRAGPALPRQDAGAILAWTEPDDPLLAATARVMASGAAMLRGYQLDPSQEIHALRMLRSTIHGFTTFEVTGGFQIDADIDGSFTWTVSFIGHGLQAATAAPTDNAPPGPRSPQASPM